MKPRDMDYDKVLEEIGQFSKWHQVQFVILTMFQCAGALATLSYSFAGMRHI